MDRLVRRKVDQTLVWEVCDELLAGEVRPTLERVRERTGGSPNTVAIHLETWFKGLSARMAALTKGEPVPQAVDGLPTQVVRLAQQLWAGAVAAAKLEAEQAITKAREDADGRVAQAEELRRRAEAALSERGERVLALEAEMARASEERRALEREKHALAQELGGAQGKLEQAEQAMLRTQADLRDARQALVQRAQESEAALRTQADQHDAERKSWLLEIDRARGDTGKAVKREEQANERLKQLQQDLTNSNQAGAQLEVRLEQAYAEAARLSRELADLGQAKQSADDSARARELDLLSRLNEASNATTSMAAEVREQHAAIERLRATVDGKRDGRPQKVTSK